MFAKRTSWELTPNKIATVLKKLRQSGTNLLDLTESNPTRCGFSYPWERILQALSAPSNKVYAPSAKGDLNAREAVCSYYKEKNIDVDPERIFLTASTSEAYSFLFRLLANPGESVLFPRPSYPLFEFLGHMNDLVLGFYPLAYAEGWGLDLAKFRSAISKDTKALVLVNPNNPTGSFIKQQELTEINKACQKHNIPVICDEVFLDYKFDKSIPDLSLTKRVQGLSFCLGGLSKTLGLPQMKLSWIIIDGPQPMVDAAISRLEIIADTYLSVNTPSQNALTEWLGLQPLIQTEIIRRLKNNREFLLNSASSGSFDLLDAEGGWYAILRLPDNCNEEQMTLELLEKNGVLVQPGYFYDFYEEPYIILSLLPPEEIFQEGVSRIAGRVKAAVVWSEE